VAGIGQAVSVSEEMALYRDRWITCTERHLVIRGYYFPTGTPKKIPYRDIRSVSLVQMRALSGKGRLWGTASPRYWAHLDLGRPWKKRALVLDLGRRVKAFITPADPERVLEIIESHRA
jgi:hypothetical protein